MGTKFQLIASDKLSKIKTKSWIFTHIVFPFFPFIFEGVLRFIIIDYRLNIHTFSAATLSLSVCLLCIFVYQSLLITKEALQNEQTVVDIKMECIKFILLGLFYFGLFVLIIAFKAYNESVLTSKSETVCSTFKILSFAFFLIPITWAIKAQKSYKLRSTLWKCG